MRHALEFSTEGFVRVAVLTRGSLQCCCDACSVLSGAEALSVGPRRSWMPVFPESSLLIVVMMMAVPVWSRLRAHVCRAGRSRVRRAGRVGDSCLRAVLVVVLSASGALGTMGALAACSRGGDDVRDGGGPSASAGSASATASPTVDLPADQAAAREAALAMPAPQKPENMDENSSEGAIATAIYFVQLYPYVYATGDLEQWKSMSRQDCLFCNSVITNVKELHESGGWKDPWVHTITQTGYSDPGPGSEYSRVDVAFDQEAAYTYDGTGAPPEVGEPQTHTVLILAMKYTDGHWEIRGGQVE